MKLDDFPEIIEIIDDDSDAFGDRPRDRVAHDDDGPRWVGPVAAAALVGLIGYGVVTSTSGPPAAPAATPATSTSLVIAVPKDFQHVATTVPDAPAIAYYAADPPQEFSVQFANGLPFGNDFGSRNYLLWATPQASATTGSWFSVTSAEGASTVYAGNSYRLESGELSIAMSRSAGGHAVAQFTSPGHLGVTIASFGWSDDDLVRLASSLEADGTSFSDDWFAADHHLVSTVSPWLAMRGLPIEQMGYSTAEDLSPAFVISVARFPDDPGRADERQIALRFLLDRITPFTVDGDPAVAGTVIGEGNLSVANWVRDGFVITVAGRLPLPQTIAVARTVHEITAPDWADIQSLADRKPGASAHQRGVPVPVSFGTDARGEEWTIDVATEMYGPQRQLVWSWDASSGGTALLDTAQITTVVDDRRTYVLADLPKVVTSSAELHILRDGLDPVIIPFADIDPAGDRTFAAFAFSEPVPYTAQVITADGAVVGTWPAP